jgi:hypothetical protein
VLKMRTVYTLPSAVDNSWQDRPPKSPGKRYITDGAGDAVGSLLGVAMVGYRPTRSRFPCPTIGGLI